MFGSREKIKAVSDELDTLQAEFRSLKIEWLDTYDRIHKLYHRLNQRDRYQRNKDEAEATNGDEGVADPYAGLDPLSRRILARRRGSHAVPQRGPKPSSGSG